MPVEFFLFAATLVGIAIYHSRTFEVALLGLLGVVTYKLGYDPGFHLGEHLRHEWMVLANLTGLLFGFGFLAHYFKDSRLPEKLPAILPDNWTGGLVLLGMVWVMSGFLDNIAAAMLGGAMAKAVFRGRVSLAFLVGIVAMSNAGGAWSVVGDTTTTMMWIAGVSPSAVFEAGLGSLVSLAIVGPIAAWQQHRHQPIQKDATPGVVIDWKRLGVVALILVGAIVTNITVDFPALGVWCAIIVGGLFVRHAPWSEFNQKTVKGNMFLLMLVLTASMMPVKELPAASPEVAMGLGLLSGVFDNIPLTKLALEQGGYDWGFLAYAVGYGGSTFWFGSSSGVALTNEFPYGKSAVQWIKHGWFVPVSYVAGYLTMWLILGWHPQ